MNTPRILSAAEVAAQLAGIDVLQEMRAMFAELGAAKAVQPPQTLTVFPEGLGDFITYLGALPGRGVFGAKLSPYLAKRASDKVTAWTLLMSLESGAPLLLCDALKLTTERTAATTALAVDHLAAKTANKIAIIGAGAVAEAHWRYVRGLRDWKRAALWSPNLATRRASGALGELEAASSLKAAIAEADTILLCTSSAGPVIDIAEAAKAELITSISTNAPKAHEIAPAALVGLEVWVDDKAATPGAAGEMVLAAEAGWSSDRIAGDLGDLCTGRARRGGGRTAYFRSIGLGLEDIAVAAAIHAKLADKDDV